MCRKLIYLVSLMMLLSITRGVQALTITTADGDGADTYLANDGQSGDYGPDSLHGADTSLRAFRQLADTRSKTGYIRFDLSGAGGDMSDATLTFDATFLKGGAKGVDVYGLIDEVGDFWDESTITYNTAAGMLTATLGNYTLDMVKVTLLGTITTPAAGDPYPVSFSSNPTDLPLTSFLGADTNMLVTFLFIGTDNEGEIASKEHETFAAPTLTLPNAVIVARTSAAKPNPANRATVSNDVVLSWMPGVYADKHDVYFGTVFDDVNEATRENDPNGVLVSQNQDATTYDPNGLIELDQTYYWRIDEINDVHPNSPWRGYVWRFTTRDYIVVDDFEDYNDYQPDRIFDTWIDGWGISANGSQVGYGSASFAEQTIVHSGSQSMPFFYNNTGGVAYSEAIRTFDSPQDWTRDGVETLTLFFRGYPRAFVEDPPGTYTISASGADVWDESDEFRYAYKILSGNGSITARVVSVDNTNSFAKAGVMIRETLDPFSAHGFMFLTPNGRRAFQNRPVAARESYSAHSEPDSISLPGWVKLTRQSIFITAYYSEDGINWIQQPTDENTGADASTNPRIIVMGSDTYIGLAYTSHNANMTGVAVFSDVTTTGTVTGNDWEVADIGVEMGDNDPESLYVTVEDAAGTVKVFEHPDNPNAVLAADWQQWDIPLSVFEDANVALTEVQKLSICVGNQTAPQTGEGKLYFDDIRLYLPTPPEPNAPAEE